jgi:hypothetical protein
MIQFRKANPEYVGLSDSEIAEDINDGFRSQLQPETSNWNGYELTFFVNPGATDIRSIKPYAAYDLKYNEWTVTPNPQMSAPTNPEWERVVSNDASTAQQIVTRYTQALQDVQTSHNDATRRNAESRLLASLQQGNALFDEIHLNRSLAFQPTGEGYTDFHNYRWQAGKREGTVQSLRELHEHAKTLRSTVEAATYGVELPNSNTLVRRAALYHQSK